MRVLVVNCGSSSLKWSVVDTDTGTLAGDTVQRVTDHGAALQEVLQVAPLNGVAAVAHRVVHGGDRYQAPTLIDDEVVAGIKTLAVLAPLHNPANALGIDIARQTFRHIPHVAIFDTAFHATLPPHAYTYALPREWGIRRFGFHGTSHAFVSRAAARLLERPVEELRQIVLHLGNGASACAVDGGRSVDTSMGLTPLAGLVMGTRSGDVDAALVPHLRRTMGMSVEEIDTALNTRSGLRALAGENDLREVHRRIAEGDEQAANGLEVYCYRIRQYVGSYLAVLGGADAVVFTAGVGQNDPVVRAKSLAGLAALGIAVDPERNAVHGPIISPPGSPVSVLVVATDEEFEMATQAAALIA